MLKNINHSIVTESTAGVTWGWRWKDRFIRGHKTHLGVSFYCNGSFVSVYMYLSL